MKSKYIYNVYACTLICLKLLVVKKILKYFEPESVYEVTKEKED